MKFSSLSIVCVSPGRKFSFSILTFARVPPVKLLGHVQMSKHSRVIRVLQQDQLRCFAHSVLLKCCRCKSIWKGTNLYGPTESKSSSCVFHICSFGICYDTGEGNNKTQLMQSTPTIRNIYIRDIWAKISKSGK